MTISGEDKEFVSYVIELMQSIGPVRARAMFGGHGIFLEQLMFGLVADSVLFLKVKQEKNGHFKAGGRKALTYIRNGKEFKKIIYKSPEKE